MPCQWSALSEVVGDAAGAEEGKVVSEARRSVEDLRRT